MTAIGAGEQPERPNRFARPILLIVILVILVLLFLLWRVVDSPYVCDASRARLAADGGAAAVVEAEPLPELDLTEAVYANNLVVVPDADVQAAVAVLDEDAGFLTKSGLPCAFTEADVITRYDLGESGGELVEQAAAETLAENAVIAFDDRWNPLSASDPQAVVDLLRRAGVDAQPLLAVSPEPHWSFQEGGEPDEPVETELDTAPGCPDGGPVVGVVDSGWSKTGISGLDCVSATGTVDPDAARHGTFVASLIRQIAPDASIELVGVALDGTGPHDLTFTGHAVDGPVTMDELGVAIGIRMLAQAPNQYAALNLSLGTFGVLERGEPVEPSMLRGAITRWSRSTGAPVFAAAGNAIPEGGAAFYPAAFEDVFGVGAGAPMDAEYTVWSSYGRAGRTTPAAPWWVSAVAPGLDLVGAVPDSPAIVRWSGSSFSTAVVSALTAVCNWQQPPAVLGYREVPNLVFAEDPAAPAFIQADPPCELAR